MRFRIAHVVYWLTLNAGMAWQPKILRHSASSILLDLLSHIRAVRTLPVPHHPANHRPSPNACCECRRNCLKRMPLHSPSCVINKLRGGMAALMEVWITGDPSKVFTTNCGGPCTEGLLSQPSLSCIEGLRSQAPRDRTGLCTEDLPPRSRLH
jgi:hypothetical protein